MFGLWANQCQVVGELACGCIALPAATFATPSDRSSPGWGGVLRTSRGVGSAFNTFSLRPPASGTREASLKGEQFIERAPGPNVRLRV